MIRRPPRSTRTDTLFPYTTLFRSLRVARSLASHRGTLRRGGKLQISRTRRETPDMVRGEATFRPRDRGRPGGTRTRTSEGVARWASRRARSAERGVGNEWVSTFRTRWSTYHAKKK